MHGADPEEAQSLLVGRRYSVQRGPSSGSGSSSGAGSVLPAGVRRSSRPNAPEGPPLGAGGGVPAAVGAGLLVPVAVGGREDDSETENIYTSEFTVV